MTKAEHKIVLGVSGGGTTMRAIGEAFRADEFGENVAIVGVIASKPKIGAIEKAHKLGIPVSIVNFNDFSSEDSFAEAMLAALEGFKATRFIQTGWTTHTPEKVIFEYEGRIDNQHPAPPECGGKGMRGKAPHCAIIEFTSRTIREPWTEAIVQRVAPEYDRGAVLKSKRVEIFPNDIPETLQRRVLPVEHELLIAHIRDIGAGTVREIERVSIVKPGQEDILQLCIADARRIYPHG
jgi:phosphoribosylglycinamide formyltransferase 1